MTEHGVVVITIKAQVHTCNKTDMAEVMALITQLDNHVIKYKMMVHSK